MKEQMKDPYVHSSDFFFLSLFLSKITIIFKLNPFNLFNMEAEADLGLDQVTPKAELKVQGLY